ncbi:MAG: efflux RND transporter periplasmic adaptor subunit [Gammaproteobacteria bacterium]
MVPAHRWYYRRAARGGRTDGEAGDVLFKLGDREINCANRQGRGRIGARSAGQGPGGRQTGTDVTTHRLASPEEADQAVADLKVAARQRRASQAALRRRGFNSDATTIRGRPSMAGLARFAVRPAIWCAARMPGGLVTVTQMQPLRVSFALPESDLELLRAALDGDQQAVVKAMAGASDKLLGEGILSFLDSQVDVTSGTIKAWAQMANDDGALWPGRYVRVAVALGRMRDVVTVPQIAVQPGQDSACVFLVTAERKVTMRKVVVKMSYANRAAIASGLSG